MMKKLSLYIFLVLMWCNFTNISKAEEIEVFCLINISDLKHANLAKEDHQRFVGKEIRFLINFDENLIADISEDEEVSVITGMYGPADMKEFTKSKIGIIYKNEINLKGDKEGEIVKYSYSNTLLLSDGKPTKLIVAVDQSGISFNKWNFNISCRDYAYSGEEKVSAKKFNPMGVLEGYNELVKSNEERERKEEEAYKKKQVPVIEDLTTYEIKNYEDLLYLYKAKLFNNKKYAGIELTNGKKIYFEDIIDLNETELFKLPLKGKGLNLRKNKLKKEFLVEKKKFE